MTESNIMSFFYGLIVAYMLFTFINRIGKRGKAHGECPFCRTVVDVTYDEMYECPECKKRYTDEEAYEQRAINDEADEKEREYQFQRQHDAQRKEEYKEKLTDLNSEYKDVRRGGRLG